MSNLESKLQHLNPEQIEALYREYRSGERITQLLERYQIDIAPSSLIRALPALPCAGLKCPYCRVSLFERPKSRTAQSVKENLAFCKTCKHRHFFASPSNWERACTCPPCQASRNRARQDQAIEQRQRIKAHWSVARRKPLALHSLSISHKLQLMALLEVRMDARRNCLNATEPASGDARVSPSLAMDASILQALHEAHILLVDPDSPLDAFSQDVPPKAWKNKVRWLGNVSLDGQQRAPLSQLYRALRKAVSDGPRPQWRDELAACIQALCIEEVCAYIMAQCTARKLPFEGRDKAHELATQLLQANSVQQAWALANTAILGALTFIARNQVSRQHAASTLAGCMLSMSDRAVIERWQLDPLRDKPPAPRSRYSQVLFDVLLKQTDHGLEHTVAQYLALLPRHG
ncbi:hypothetical protein F3J44_01005 [Pantoea sp. Tr-811]|uniref:hypothetical protein n=1 Tax=Pantoea sp. Tr-811 TaxID=2608361 RepID=UPI0014229C3B|nr:hypothetical protein [Pantoea sp. Tr-811]NIF24949.1 hypothetical protein [Pantoea sp. Tr-811]